MNTFERGNAHFPSPEIIQYNEKVLTATNIYFLAGGMGAGKGTAAEFLASKTGFTHMTVSSIATEFIATSSNPFPSRYQKDELSRQLRLAYGKGAWGKIVLGRISEMHQSNPQPGYIVEGFRYVEDLEFIRGLNLPLATILWLKASPEERYRRTAERGRDDDFKSLEEFKAKDSQEAVWMNGISNLADFEINTGRAREEVFKDLEAIRQLRHPLR